MAQSNVSAQSPKFLDRVRDRMHVLHDSLRTEYLYVNGIKRFLPPQDKRIPASAERCAQDEVSRHEKAGALKVAGLRCGDW